MQNLYLFVTIIKKNDEEEFSEFFIKQNALPIYSTLCEGATNSDTLNILGIEKSQKVFMQSIVTEDHAKQLKIGLTYDMHIDLPDRGIAISIPLSSIASKTLFEKIQSQGQAACDRDKIQFSDERKFNMELIISICPKGNSAEIMKAARKAGAAGGTIIKAKGTAGEGLDTFFGMSISNEKEIILIVAKKDSRSPIMQAIASYKSPDGLQPIAFSLPVSDVAGLRLMRE